MELMLSKEQAFFSLLTLTRISPDWFVSKELKALDRTTAFSPCFGIAAVSETRPLLLSPLREIVFPRSTFNLEHRCSLSPLIVLQCPLLQ